MKDKKLYYKDCHLAGRKYHDADEVFDQLKVGQVVSLQYEPDNRYDENAVQVIYSARNAETGEDTDYILGYIPRSDNYDIALFLRQGWTDLFECRISQIDPYVQPEQQIHLTIRIKPTNITIR